MSYARIMALTSLVMMAFAGNSLLCRVALKHTGGGNWLSALALFVYAAGFSFAYVSLPAATSVHYCSMVLVLYVGRAVDDFVPRIC